MKKGEREKKHTNLWSWKGILHFTFLRTHILRSVSVGFEWVPRQMIYNYFINCERIPPLRDRISEKEGREPPHAHFVAKLGKSYIYSVNRLIDDFRLFGTKHAKRVHKIEIDWWIKAKRCAEVNSTMYKPHIVGKHILRSKAQFTNRQAEKESILFSIQLISLPCKSLFTCPECTHVRFYVFAIDRRSVEPTKYFIYTICLQWHTHTFTHSLQRR